ncbi:MAG: FkbM family methyltransferase [Candidatus Caldarchaeum sp.]
MARLLMKVSAFINTASLYLLYAMWLPLYFSLRILLRSLLGRERRNLWLTRMQLDSLSSVNYIGGYLLDRPMIWSTKYGLMLTIIKEEVLKYVMGLLEPYQRRLVHAKKGGIVIDIGANIGFYTLKFAREVGKDGLVVSLEPNPYAFKLLNYNIRLNELQGR